MTGTSQSQFTRLEFHPLLTQRMRRTALFSAGVKVMAGNVVHVKQNLKTNHLVWWPAIQMNGHFVGLSTPVMLFGRRVIQATKTPRHILHTNFIQRAGLGQHVFECLIRKHWEKNTVARLLGFQGFLLLPGSHQSIFAKCRSAKFYSTPHICLTLKSQQG